METRVSITLSKSDGANPLDGITTMGVGVSWDPSGRGKRGLLGRILREVGEDLDLLAVLFVDNEPVRFAGLDSLDPLGNGGVTHTGDSQSGKGAGDDELVNVQFDRLGPVDRVVYVAAAFKNGTSFENANNISFKVYDSTGGGTAQVADIWPSLLGADNANAVAEARKTGAGWVLEVTNRKGKIRQGDIQSLLRFAQG
jgi:tellurium resistance protein TerZ